MKIVVFFSTVTGAITPILIDWQHVAEKIIETGIVSFFTGLLGAMGGLLVAWFAKRYLNIKKV